MTHTRSIPPQRDFLQLFTRLHRVTSIRRIVKQHDDKQKQHHDRAGIDDDLNHRRKWALSSRNKPGQAEESDDQEESTVDGVTLDDHRGGGNGNTRQQPKEQRFHASPTIRTVPGVPWSSHPALGRRHTPSLHDMLLEILSE